LIAVPKLVDFVYVIADEQKHSLSMEVVENFKSNVIPFLQELESGPIHGDFNEQNILGNLLKRNLRIRKALDSIISYFAVGADKEDPEKYSISGMLDFGDVHFGYYLFDISIAICYMMIECKSMDMLDAPGHVLAGYNRVRPIPQKEFDLLKVFGSQHF
jgi:hydroxylysine kinase